MNTKTTKSRKPAQKQQLVRQPLQNKFDIAGEFVLGMVAALATEGRVADRSTHWLAGWDAGYLMKQDRDARLNRYLRSINVNEIGTVRLV